MQTKALVVYFMLYIFFANVNCSENETLLRGEYLGQEPPGMEAEIFAPGFFSSNINEFNATFTPSGDHLYFTTNTKKGGDIMVIERKNGIWQVRKKAEFTGRYQEVDPFVTPDGKRLYFSSNRPVDGGEPRKDHDIWFVELTPTGIRGEPRHLYHPSTIDLHDYYYTSSRGGSVYFSIMDYDENGDLYYLPSGLAESKPVKLESPINTEHTEHDPYIAPDESFLIFTSNRPGGYGSADLYICFRLEDGKWTDPVNMGENINSSKYDYCPILSPDGKYLFFSSSRTGNGDVYWVDARIIEVIKNKSSR